MRNIVNVASFPRSANGYFRQVAWSCYGIPNTTVYNEPDEAWTGRHLSLDTIPEDMPTLLKTHALPAEEEPPTILLVRNPLSCYYSLANLVAHNRGGKWSDHIEDIISGKDYGLWTDFTKAWMGSGHVKAVVHYDDLIANPIDVVTDALAKAGIATSNPEREKLQSFEELHRIHPVGYRAGRPYGWHIMKAHMINRIIKNEWVGSALLG